jgi:signal recognition particle subunit SRP54
MGDMLTLIEQAERHFDAEQSARMAEKVLGPGELTFDDFLEQMQAVRKMGPIGNLLGMLPGMQQYKEQIDQVDDRDIDRITAIIRSMTPAERADPKIINGSRRLRIANGSGTTVTEVNGLVERFFEARKMMKQLPGMMGMGRRTSKARKTSNKSSRKSGGRTTRPGAVSSGQGRPALPPAGPILPPLGTGGSGTGGAAGFGDLGALPPMRPGSLPGPFGLPDPGRPAGPPPTRRG